MNLYADEIAFRTPFVCVAIHCADPSLLAQAASLFASYEPVQGDVAEVRFQLERLDDSGTVRIQRVGEVASVPREDEHEADALARLEGMVYRSVIAAARNSGWQPLHAAALAVGERGLLLVGESGAGKSTLALELLRGGSDADSDDHKVRYLTDDVAFLGTAHDANLLGLPRLIGFDEPWPESTHALPPGFVTSQWQASGQHPGTTVSRYAVAVPQERVRHAPVALAAIVLPRYEPQLDSAVLEPLAPLEATAAVWPALIEPPTNVDTAFAQVATLVQQVPVHRLRSPTRKSARNALATALNLT